MSIIKKELSYAKEVGEVMELLVGIVKTIKAKGDYAALVPQLITAVDGAQDVDDEFKADAAVVEATIGYHVGELAGAFMNKVEA